MCEKNDCVVGTVQNITVFEKLKLNHLAYPIQLTEFHSWSWSFVKGKPFVEINHLRSNLSAIRSDVGGTSVHKTANGE